MAEKEINLTFAGYWREPAISGLPDESGVYCVYTCTHDKESKKLSLKRIIYIGESEDVKKRISKHEKRDEWKTYTKQGEVICISCAKVANSTRERAEAAMIYKHKPSANTEYVNSFPYDKTTILSSGENELLESQFTVLRDD